MIHDALQQAVLMGTPEVAASLTSEHLAQGSGSQDILNDQLLPAMAMVGERFKRNEMFLPQVLMSAQAMQAAIDVLKPHLTSKSGGRSQRTILIGTVQGDMHDIGKNLVRIMLVGAGFEVIDLGVNVSAQAFLEAAENHHPDVVCLSALLSSTMSHMKDVVNTFQQSALRDTKILVGGAPVNREFSDRIGAHGYAPSAPAAVELVQEICQNQARQ